MLEVSVGLNIILGGLVFYLVYVIYQLSKGANVSVSPEALQIILDQRNQFFDRLFEAASKTRTEIDDFLLRVIEAAIPKEIKAEDILPNLPSIDAANEKSS